MPYFDIKRPDFTPSSALIAILKHKTLKWSIKPGYFEVFITKNVKIQLIPSEKCAIIQKFDETGGITRVEVWDLRAFGPVSPVKHLRILFYKENLAQIGITLLNPSVDLSDLSTSDPLKLCGLIEDNDFHVRNKQMDAPWALVKIGTYKYVAQWSLASMLILKSPDQPLKYFDVFQSVPIPIEFVKFGAVPYYHVDRFRKKILVHYPTKKKDRGRPKEIVCLPPVEKIYGFPLIELELTDDNQIVQVMNLHRSQWFAENTLQDDTPCNDDTRDQMCTDSEQTQ